VWRILVPRVAFARVAKGLVVACAHACATITIIVALQCDTLVNLNACLPSLIDPTDLVTIIALAVIRQKEVMAVTMITTVVAMAPIDVRARVLRRHASRGQALLRELSLTIRKTID
jgi:hypothetical protein